MNACQFFCDVPYTTTAELTEIENSKIDRYLRSISEMAGIFTFTMRMSFMVSTESDTRVPDLTFSYIPINRSKYIVVGAAHLNLHSNLIKSTHNKLIS